MTRAVPLDMMAFDVERGLSKALSIRVETFACGPDEFKFRIGQRWNLLLDRDQLEDLWHDVDCYTALKDKFDGMKADCLAFQSYRQ